MSSQRCTSEAAPAAARSYGPHFSLPLLPRTATRAPPGRSRASEAGPKATTIPPLPRTGCSAAQRAPSRSPAETTPSGRSSALNSGWTSTQAWRPTGNGSNGVPMSSGCSKVHSLRSVCLTSSRASGLQVSRPGGCGPSTRFTHGTRPGPKDSSSTFNTPRSGRSSSQAHHSASSTPATRWRSRNHPAAPSPAAAVGRKQHEPRNHVAACCRDRTRSPRTAALADAPV